MQNNHDKFAWLLKIAQKRSKLQYGGTIKFSGLQALIKAIKTVS